MTSGEWTVKEFFIWFAVEDGTEAPYELNITWYNALNSEQKSDPLRLQIKRFLTPLSQTTQTAQC